MLKKLLSLLADAGVYGLSSVAGQLISFLLLPLYTRYLSPADYGVLAMLHVALMLMQGLAPLGVTDAIFRRLSLSSDSSIQGRELSTALLSVTCSTLVFCLVGLVLAEQVSYVLVGDTGYSLLTRLTLITATLMALGDVPRRILQAKRCVWIISMISLCKITVTIGLTIYTVVGLGLGALGCVLAGLITESLFLGTYFLPVLGAFGRSFSMTAWRSMLAYGLPILPHRSMMLIALMYGNYSVRQMLGLDQAGLFDMANKFALPLGVMITSFQTAWQPYKYEVYTQEKDPAAFFRATFTYYVAFTACVWVAGSCWIPDILRLMTAHKFHGAAALVPMILLSRVLMGTYYMLGSGVEFSDNTRPLVLISSGGLAMVVAFSYLLIPVIGAQGAAIANSLGWLVMGMIGFFVANTRIRIDYEWRTLGLIVAFAATFVLLSAEMQSLSPWIRCVLLAATSLLFPLVVWTLLVQYSQEADRLRHRAASMFSVLRGYVSYQ